MKGSTYVSDVAGGTMNGPFAEMRAIAETWAKRYRREVHVRRGDGLVLFTALPPKL